MANDSNIWTRIITDYRAFAHIVEGVTVLFCVLLFMFSAGLSVIWILYITYGVIEVSKGSFLLEGIIKEKKSCVVIYLWLSALTLLAKKGFVLYALSFDLMSVFILIILILLYFTYEWGTYIFVYKFYNDLKNKSQVGNANVSKSIPCANKYDV